MKNKIIITALLSLCVSQAYANEQLFINTKNNTLQAPPTEMGAIKTGLSSLKGLRVNPTAMKATELTFTLPNGVNLNAKSTNQYVTKSGSNVWIGKHKKTNSGLADFGGEETILVSRDGKITGSIRSNGKLFELRSAADGTHSLTEIDTAQFFDHDPITLQNTPYKSAYQLKNSDELTLLSNKRNLKRGKDVAAFDQNKLLVKPDVVATPMAAAPMAAAPIAPSVIRVLVNYTAKAKTAAGDMDALIDLALAETNQSYVNSNINARVELAYKAQVSYTEVSIDTDKPRYMGKTDGFMDEIHAQRDQYGADVSVFIAEYGSGGCGSASAIGAVESDAFVVVKRSCASGSLSFGHEIGHLYGALHDPETTSTMLPYAYGHGYQSPDNKWRTIMSYTCSPACPRLMYWSNPFITYTDGQVMGTEAISNNVRVLNDRAAVLAAFRNDAGVNTAPIVNAGVDQNVRIPATASLVGSATDDGKPTGSTLTTTWTKVSGPGTVVVGNANALNTTASFSVAGVYVLRLTASDSALQTSDDVSINVTTNQAPTADFSAIVNNLIVQFTDASSDSDGSIVSRSWNFGDGTSSTATSPSHNYATAGTYNVTLNVTDNDGATHTKSASVVATSGAVNVVPVANFNVGINNLIASFTDTSSDLDGSVVGWSWNFGDGTTSNSQNVTKTYAAAGTYNVTLIVTDNKGAQSSSVLKQVSVTAAPVGTEVVLEQNTSGGSKMDVQKGIDGAQSFKHGTTGTYTVSKIEFYLSRESSAPDGDLVISLGTAKNAGTIANTTANISSGTVSNTTSGSTFQKMTITYNQPVTLNAGTTYYINMRTTAPNAKNYYVEYKSTNTYANGQYFDDGTAKSGDLRFALIGK